MDSRKRIAEVDLSNPYGDYSADGLKRARTEQNSVPSKALHVRGLPPNTSEAELSQLCIPFGAVVKILLLGAKQQAFVEMDSVESATALVYRYSEVPAMVRGKNVYFSFSNRSEIHTPAGHSNALQASGMVGYGDQKNAPELPNAIVLVTITNVRVPVTMENVLQVFRPHAEVLKIITFNKGDQFKALVQCASVEQAAVAKANLDGKDMFMGCCHLQVRFSSLPDLQVKQNGPKSWDFTNPNAGLVPAVAPLQQAISAPLIGQGIGMGFSNPAAAAAFGAQAQIAIPQMIQGGLGCVVLVSNLPDGFTCDYLFHLFGVYGDVMRVKILWNKRNCGLVQFASSQQAAIAAQHLNKLALDGKELQVSISKHPEIAMQEGSELTKDYSNSPIHRFRRPDSRAIKHLFAPSQVLHVSSVPERADEAVIRQLFAQPESKTMPIVSFFPNNRTQCWIGMPSVRDAVYALMKLHNFKLFEKYLRVSFTKRNISELTDSDGPGAPSSAAAPEPAHA